MSHVSDHAVLRFLEREPNGRWPLRPCPNDFDKVFVLIGRLACEAHYHARRKVITRWLEERGKDRLIEARAVFVRIAATRGGPVNPRRLPTAEFFGFTADLTDEPQRRVGSGK